MSEHFKGVPYALFINPFRLGSFNRDLDRSIALRRAEFLFRQEQTASGLGEDAKKFGWRMMIGRSDRDLYNERDRLDDSVDHSAVVILPTRMLLDIRKGLGWFSRLRETVRAGFKEPWA